MSDLMLLLEFFQEIQEHLHSKVDTEKFVL